MTEAGLFGIADDVDLLRRIHRHQVIDGGRISSCAFEGRELSCYDGTKIEGESVAAKGANPPYAVARLVARDARSEEQSVDPDPLPDDDAHVLVVGEKPRARRKRLADMAMRRGWALAPTW